MEKTFQLEEMPLLQHYSAGMPATLLSGLEVLYINHIISDSLMVARAIKNIGANLTIIPIPYGPLDSVERQELIKGFDELGNVILPKVESPAKFAQAMRNAVTEALASLSEKVGEKRKLMIIEDGGYAFPILHDDPSFKELLDNCIGAVEHTARGMWNYQYMEQDGQPKTKRDLKKPAVTLANSTLKSKFEPAIVAEAIIDELRYTLRRRHRFIKYGTALVIGAGRIGAAIAKGLVAQELKVRVCDNDESKLQPIISLVETANKVDRDLLADVDLIIGATGLPSFNLNDLETFLDANSDRHANRRTLYIVSASSKQLEFGELYANLLDPSAKVTLGLQSISHQVLKDFGTIFTLTKDKQTSWEVCFAGDGYPIIFFPSHTHGAPNRAMDLIMSEQFLAGCLLAANHSNLQPRLYSFANIRDEGTELVSGPWMDLKDEEKIYNNWCELNGVDSDRISNFSE